MNKKILFLTQAAVIAAIYAILTFIFAPISYGMMQVRISEALTILPYFTPAAIPGLFIGVIIVNMFSVAGIIDVVFGSLATLIAAFLSYKLRNKKSLVPLPPVLVNAVIVGIILYYAFMNDPEMKAPLYIIMMWVGLGQMIACYGLGYPLMNLLEKYKGKLFS